MEIVNRIDKYLNEWGYPGSFDDVLLRHKFKYSDNNSVGELKFVDGAQKYVILINGKDNSWRIEKENGELLAKGKGEKDLNSKLNSWKPFVESVDNKVLCPACKKGHLYFEKETQSATCDNCSEMFFKPELIKQVKESINESEIKLSTKLFNDMTSKYNNIIDKVNHRKALDTLEEFLSDEGYSDKEVKILMKLWQDGEVSN